MTPEMQKELELRKRLERTPCLIHGDKAIQQIISFNVKTGYFKIKCVNCMNEEKISNIIAGRIKKV